MDANELEELLGRCYLNILVAEEEYVRWGSEPDEFLHLIEGSAPSLPKSRTSSARTQPAPAQTELATRS